MLDTLQQGKKKLGSEARKRMASFVGSQLTGNGAFMDKTGSDDLYYTPFGLMLAFVLQLNINTMLTGQWLENRTPKCRIWFTVLPLFAAVCYVNC